MKNWQPKLHLKNVQMNNNRSKFFLFILVVLINVSSYCQSNKEQEKICNCKQIYTYRDQNSILNNNAIINEYFADSILIVKYGSYDLSKKLSFDNFIEFELRRDTFIIIDGNYFKDFNGYRYPILSREYFFTRSNTIKINYMPTIARITKKTFVPKGTSRINDTTYFLYETSTSRLVPSSDVKLTFQNLINLKETYSYSDTNFVIDENSLELAYFDPGRGFIKIDQKAGYRSTWVIDFLQTEKCNAYISATFFKWHIK
jgi:hypothetical protein